MYGSATGLLVIALWITLSFIREAHIVSFLWDSIIET
jgi:hypothetical protein